MNTHPTPSLLGANAPRGCAPDCSFGCWEDWLGWAAPQGSFFSAPQPVPTLPSPLCPADNLKKRIANINHYLTYNLYSNVCRSLFEKHKLMFAFLLCARIMMNQGKINQVRGREAAAARSRTDGLRGCPVAELREQGGKTGHIRQEGTAIADGQRPPETVICVKQPGGPGLTMTQQVLCTGLLRALRVLVSRDRPEPPGSRSHECQGFCDALGSIESDILHCLSPHCVPSAGLTTTL